MRWLNRFFEFVGKVGLFSLQVLVDSLRPPFEFAQFSRQISEVGNKSLALVIVSGFALGAVMTLHTRSTLVMFGATAMIPAVQSVGFFVEIGPLVAGLLLAGRVGSGIGAVLANMRASEQIDAIESLSIDSFKFLVVPRVLACVIALPFLTLSMDFAGLKRGFCQKGFPLTLRQLFTSTVPLTTFSGRTLSRPRSRPPSSVSSSAVFLAILAIRPIRGRRASVRLPRTALLCRHC